MGLPKYTPVDLVWSFLFAIVYVLLFLIQKRMKPGYYFESSDVIYGFRTNTKMLVILFRVLLIIGFGFLLSLLFRNYIIPVTAATLGAFLIVWPALLHPDPITYLIGRRKWLLYVAYLLFIAISLSGSLIGCMLYGLVDPLFQEYWRETLTIGGLFRIFMDNMVVLLFLAATGLLKIILRIFDKSIRGG